MLSCVLFSLLKMFESFEGGEEGEGLGGKNACMPAVPHSMTSCFVGRTSGSPLRPPPTEPLPLIPCSDLCLSPLTPPRLSNDRRRSCTSSTLTVAYLLGTLSLPFSAATTASALKSGDCPPPPPLLLILLSQLLLLCESIIMALLLLLWSIDDDWPLTSS